MVNGRGFFHSKNKIANGGGMVVLPVAFFLTKQCHPYLITWSVWHPMKRNGENLSSVQRERRNNQAPSL